MLIHDMHLYILPFILFKYNKIKCTDCKNKSDTDKGEKLIFKLLRNERRRKSKSISIAALCLQSVSLPSVSNE